MEQTLAEQIDTLLPQTQCTKCGYSGCKPYANAIAKGQAEINQCPPGGDEGSKKLAILLGKQAIPLNPKFGKEKPRTVAFIVEEHCIGCGKCLDPCPTDAIIGSNKYMHTVISEECTGCDLCVSACPVDCIIMQDLIHPSAWDTIHANNARQRYKNKQVRLAKQEQEKSNRQQKQKQKLARLKAQNKPIVCPKHKV